MTIAAVGVRKHFPSQNLQDKMERGLLVGTTTSAAVAKSVVAI